MPHPFLSAEFIGDRVYECFYLKALAESVYMQNYVPFFEVPPETRSFSLKWMRQFFLNKLAVLSPAPVPRHP